MLKKKILLLFIIISLILISFGLKIKFLNEKIGDKKIIDTMRPIGLTNYLQ